MPTAGLSLVGFMDEAQAIVHLRTACVPATGATDDVLRAEWNAARASLGAPIANAGNPAIQQIPAAHANYCVRLFALPWVAAAFQGQPVTSANVQLVEIDPLLAYQFTVDTDRSAQHCGALGTPPTIDELLATCLPLTQPSESFSFQKLGQSAIIKSRSLNLRVRAEGIIDNVAAGVLFGPALPLVQVVRLNGRCYLHNGFHRAYGLRQRGAQFMPCILRDVADAQSAGIRTDGLTFSEALLTSNNPPAIAHFAGGRAKNVQLRIMSRILHVSWADYVWAEE